ncbi:MAG: hypothetical protein Q8R82_05785 [Hyphomonadaceae bacterium]|nr:hypothetical protein [Hyphomonadaceae bacterium]
MSFGKRGTGEGHPARNLLPPTPVEPAGDASVGRMKVANPGSIDKGFIALALGVVMVSAGAAIAAPSVLDMFGTQVRPIETVVAGLDRTQAKAALAREAFPDGEGRAFMSSLQSHFPTDHDQLLNLLADEALSGGDRDDLLQKLNLWSVEFVPPILPAIGRTGADGFDELLNIGGGAFDVVEKTAGCTADKLEAFVSNPANLAKSWTYGSESYKFSMQASEKLVNLAAKGRNAPPPPTDFRPEDEEALMTAFFGMMMDEQFTGLIASAGPNANFGSQTEALRSIDICKMGRSVIYKLRRLPHGTKERIFGIGTQALDQIPADVMKQMMSGKGGYPGIPGVNAPPSGFPTHLLEGPSIEDMRDM